MKNFMINGIEFAIGPDGLPYAFWRGMSYAWEYADAIHDEDACGVVACFDGYENACLLQHTIGM